MDLHFLGCGDAFNTKYRNTSAYFKCDKILFLIDCGETVFSSLIDNNILEDIEEMYIFITHTHADHIGSIGTLIMYNYFKTHIKTHIVLSRDVLQKKNIDAIVHAFGCFSDMFDYLYVDELDNRFQGFDEIRYLKTTHYNSLECYSILIKYDGVVIFYSGDTNELETLKKVICEYKIDKIYIDTTSSSYDGNVHMNIDLLHESIDSKLYSKIYCMHVNDDECERLIHEYGFNFVGDL